MAVEKSLLLASGGGVSASWSFDLEARLRKAIESIPETVRRELLTETAGLTEGAREKWPVRRKDSLDSRGRLFSTITASTTAFTGIVVSPAPYTVYIKSHQNGLAGRGAWVTLVRAPAKVAAERLGRKILSGSIFGGTGPVAGGR